MDNLDHRLQRLEEKHAFTERTAEELSAELVRAYEQIERLIRRIESLEQRIGAMNEPNDDNE